MWQPNPAQARDTASFFLMEVVNFVHDSTRLLYRDELQGPSPDLLLHITESGMTVTNFHDLDAREMMYVRQQGRLHFLGYPAAEW